MNEFSDTDNDSNSGARIEVGKNGEVRTFSDATHYDSTGTCSYEELWGKTFRIQEYYSLVKELENRNTDHNHE